MTIHIHPDNPQPRLVKQALETVRAGGVLVYSSNSGYALGCGLGNKSGVEHIRRLRLLIKVHSFRLLCRDLSEIAVYVPITSPVFRFLKAHTPGPYTFILIGDAESSPAITTYNTLNGKRSVSECPIIESFRPYWNNCRNHS